jgi:hypothetical protein
MAYSVTIFVGLPQFSPDFGIGHVAIAVNTPDGSIFAGFGPNYDSEYARNAYTQGQFDMEWVPAGGAPTAGSWTNTLEYNSSAAFEIPVSEEQAYAIIAGMGSFSNSVPNYNVLNNTVCSTVIGQFLQAGGFGNGLIPTVPTTAFLELKAIADALAINPAATEYYSPTSGGNMPVPEGLRGLQQVPGAPSGEFGNLSDANVLSSYTSTNGNALLAGAKAVGNAFDSAMQAQNQAELDQSAEFLQGAQEAGNALSSGAKAVANAFDSAMQAQNQAELDQSAEFLQGAQEAGTAVGDLISSGWNTATNAVSFGASTLWNWAKSGLQYISDSIITPANGETNPGTPAVIGALTGADQAAAAAGFLPDPANLVDPNITGQFGTSGWPADGLPGQTGDAAPSPDVQVVQGSISTGGATLGSGDPPPDTYGPSGPTGYYSGYPVVLDLSGKGIKITPLGSSNQFFNMTGDGYENRAAWAGPGNGVLVFDPTGSHKITSPMQFEFTRWDPTAKSDDDRKSAYAVTHEV